MSQNSIWKSAEVEVDDISHEKLPALVYKLLNFMKYNRKQLQTIMINCRSPIFDLDIWKLTSIDDCKTLQGKLLNSTFVTVFEIYF